MEMRYFVDYKLHNAKNDGWAFKTTKNTTDLAEAKKDYHSQLSQYIGSTDFDFVQVTLSDMYGNKVLSEYWQKPVPSGSIHNGGTDFHTADHRYQ